MTLFFVSEGFSQETRSAILTNDGIVQIPEDEVPDGRFDVDVSHMVFSDNSEMTTFFMERSDENFMFRALPHENKAILLVRGSNQPDWSVTEWNAYIASKLADKAIKQ